MTATDPRSLARQIRDSPVLLVRSGWGALLLLRPDIGIRVLGGEGEPSKPARMVIRTLGARHLIQVGLELGRGPSWRRIGAAVDILHSSSAVGFALVDRRWRRTAFTDAAVAGGFGVVGLLAGGRDT